MKKFFKGLFVVISIICIAFACFFVAASATGHISTLAKLEIGIAKLAGSTDAVDVQAADSSTSTVSMLANTYGLTTQQAGSIVALAEKAGVNTNDAAEMNGFIAKTTDNSDAIKSIAEQYQSGAISESQAKAMLTGVLNG